MKEPIYMQNNEWWTTDENGYVVLTDKVPEEARRAYEQDMQNGDAIYIPGAKEDLDGFLK